jgi:hypothetical protein
MRAHCFFAGLLRTAQAAFVKHDEDRCRGIRGD